MHALTAFCSGNSLCGARSLVAMLKMKLEAVCTALALLTLIFAFIALLGDEYVASTAFYVYSYNYNFSVSFTYGSQILAGCVN
jgi:hypothetical protein